MECWDKLEDPKCSGPLGNGSRRVKLVTAVRRFGGPPAAHVFLPEHAAEFRTLVATNSRQFRFWVCLRPREPGR